MAEPASERLSLAQDLLREAVYQSRAKQAAGTSLALSESPASSTSKSASPSTSPSTSGGCGLGARAAIESELSPKGRELAGRLWPAPLDEASAARVRERIAAWVERQDALDRKRNHFLRDFRQANGFDRTRYSTEQLAAFESGLARINGDEDRLRADAAAGLLGP